MNMRLGTMAILFAVGGLAAGCSNRDDEAKAPVVATAQPQSKDRLATSATPRPAPEAKSDPVLTADGVTGARIGTSWRTVSKSFETQGAYGDDASGCETYLHRDGKFGAMVIEDKIVRVEVYEPGIRTADGVGIGSTLAELKKAYGNRLIAEKNIYDGEDIQFVWTSKDRGLVFYTDKGKVRFMAGGGPAIRYVEGCL